MRRRRKRVDRAQAESRWLGRIALLNQPSLTGARDLLVRALRERWMVNYMEHMLGTSV